MKFGLAFAAVFATALAMPSVDGHGADKADTPTCESHQTVVCNGNGNGGLVSLGNLLTGLLGESCAGGDVYCCSESDVEQVS